MFLCLAAARDCPLFLRTFQGLLSCQYVYQDTQFLISLPVCPDWSKISSKQFYYTPLLQDFQNGILWRGFNGSRECLFLSLNTEFKYMSFPTGDGQYVMLNIDVVEWNMSPYNTVWLSTKIYCASILDFLVSHRWNNR